LRTGELVRLYTRNAYCFADRYNLIVDAIASLPVKSCAIDGEAIVVDKNGLSVFELLRSRAAVSYGKARTSPRCAELCLHVADNERAMPNLVRGSESAIKSIIQMRRNLIQWARQFTSAGAIPTKYRKIAAAKAATAAAS
jgi:hypothetical protein